ncbi:MAG: hypothetical protein HZC28_07750 [Spirochaetes bacterium]|nr:hypothetical protein [Spirochaetota bacterium]
MKTKKSLMSPGFYPFWFWNDRLEETEIRRQIREMSSQGIKGFYVHSRQGLEQPYLSEAFFTMLDAAIDEAAKHDMTVHLYDEYPYPSGIAGGEVVAGEPGLYATRLHHKKYTIDGGNVRLELPNGKLLAATLYPLNDGKTDWKHGADVRNHIGMVLTDETYEETGLTSYNRKRYFTSEPKPVLEITLPEKKYILIVSVQQVIERFKYWGQLPDVLNPEVAKRFIAMTHERYKKRYGKLFDKRMPSIFIDEVAPEWSTLVPAAFKKRYGYDLIGSMSALADESHPRHADVASDLNRLTYEMFCRSFEKPIALWCRKNGIAYTGEKPSYRLSQLKLMDIPGCDPGHTKAGAKPDIMQHTIRGNAKAAASAAYFYGKRGAICECYHSMGWSSTLEDAKLIADMLLLAGITYLTPHAFFYTTHALKKHDAPPTFFFQMPFWPLFGNLSRHIDEIGQLLAGTYIDAEVLVVDPHAGMPTPEDETFYSSMLWALAGAHIDFHIVDTDILESGTIREKRVHIKDISARIVIVPPQRVIEKELRIWLSQFKAKGGIVIDAERVDHDTAAFITSVTKKASPSLSIHVNGKEITDVLTVKRKKKSGTLWFVVNTGGTAYDAEISTETSLSEHILSGNQPPSLQKAGKSYRRVIHPFESFMLKAGSDETASPAAITVHAETMMKVKPQHKNLLRMYDWTMSLLDEQGIARESAVVPALPLSNQLEKGKFTFMPKTSRGFGTVPLITFPPLSVRYEYHFTCDYSGDVLLVMEPGSIKGAWTITVNDAVITAKDFASCNAHVRGSLGAVVTPFLKQGDNSIRVSVNTARADDGLINALYLAGDFGVRISPPAITKPVTDGGFECHEKNLLPYYAGVIEYDTSFQIDKLPAGDDVLVNIDFGIPLHDAAELSVNGGDWRPLLWEPRRIMMPVSGLRHGKNSLAIKVYTTLIRSFEGMRFNHATHRYEPVSD